MPIPTGPQAAAKLAAAAQANLAVQKAAKETSAQIAADRAKELADRAAASTEGPTAA